ncbi:hypothetical protein F5Y14DRAFT_416317 [Nemania sp. NC0429]|nr:hypothetical protein F5Y14DRAFT_416317 [Nemania sp. NC0429]
MPAASCMSIPTFGYRSVVFFLCGWAPRGHLSQPPYPSDCDVTYFVEIGFINLFFRVPLPGLDFVTYRGKHLEVGK